MTKKKGGLERRDLAIITRLRENARQRLTNISRRTHIPVTTIYDNLKRYEKWFIKKHTCLIDFEKLGFNARAKVALKTNGSKTDLLDYLQNHPNVNSLYRTSSEFDVLAEIIFQELRDVDEFLEMISRKFEIEKSFVINITENLKQEEFLTELMSE